jgi:hypothetical protein
LSFSAACISSPNLATFNFGFAGPGLIVIFRAAMSEGPVSCFASSRTGTLAMCAGRKEWVFARSAASGVTVSAAAVGEAARTGEGGSAAAAGAARTPAARRTVTTTADERIDLNLTSCATLDDAGATS